MKKVLVKNSKGKQRVVQKSQIPAGYKYIKDYENPNEKKPLKKPDDKAEDK